jgi:hypothetical protein
VARETADVAAAPKARGFRVPFGLAGEELVGRSEAERGAEYACPACGAPLVLRAGAIKSKHLSHKPSATCTPETVLHATAKLLLARTLHAWLAGTTDVTCHRTCDDCGESMPFQLPRSRADRVAVEQRLACGRIPDVSLWLGGDCTLAVEVFVTHAVDEDKDKALPVHWIELCLPTRSSASFSRGLTTHPRTRHQERRFAPTERSRWPIRAITIRRSRRSRWAGAESQ